MSEEIRREGELNERELANVSGGQAKLSTKFAEHICQDCLAHTTHSTRYKCNGSTEQLAAYICNHVETNRWSTCPFLVYPQ